MHDSVVPPGRRGRAGPVAGRAQKAPSEQDRDRTEPRLSGTDIEAAHRAASRSTDPGSADLPMSLVGILFRLAPRLVDLLDLGARDYGLGFARGRVLWALRESGPVLMRALSEALGVSPRTVTGLVDALEADGWVTRSPHPADRRATIISLTPTAESALARLDASYRALAADLLGDVPESDLACCRAVVRRLEGRLDDAVSRRIADFDAAAGHDRPRRRLPRSSRR